ncbi:hypothetical protein [Hymenobacter fodinae]|uniref:Uncharacterized protein n=1 Tax=Hymenobacter fodinae TaxID=2510796 RepID=A0A4Z0PCI4_9BACT|nr:hypothetical protein [Hymenobacter fodinae]TGE09951.1 hypothetical protein EU556_03760 [Hymenobacter fodinae]
MSLSAVRLSSSLELNISIQRPPWWPASDTAVYVDDSPAGLKEEAELTAARQSIQQINESLLALFTHLFEHHQPLPSLGEVFLVNGSLLRVTNKIFMLLGSKPHGSLLQYMLSCDDEDLVKDFHEEV